MIGLFYVPEEWQAMDSPSRTQVDSLSPQQSGDALEPFASQTTAASPIATASVGSVPSPNSPPESATLAASDNVEMLTRLSSIVELGRSCSGTQTLDPPSHTVPMEPIKILRTAWTQTVPSQSTPLLMSLISSPTSVREATTSPTNFDIATARPEGISTWATCLPNAVPPTGDMARDAMQDVLRFVVTFFFPFFFIFNSLVFRSEIYGEKQRK